MDETNQNTQSNKSGKDKDPNLKYWLIVFSTVTGTATILALIYFLIGKMQEPLYLFTCVFCILVVLFCFYLAYLHKKWEKLLDTQNDKIINKWKKSFIEILSKEKEISDYKDVINNISQDVKKIIQVDDKMDEDVSKIIGMSKFIFNKRKELWKNSHDGIEVNNLLRSLVYPSSSFYSVTAFVIGKQGDKATDMLFMKSKDTTGREQEYDVLGQRMPINSVPHNYVKSLIKKYIHNYDESDIQFSPIFHKMDEEFKEGQIDLFTKQVPSPYRIQEEINSQSDGSPFFLDYIYVLEVQKKGTNGVLQSDLKAEWVNLVEVKKICYNGASPTRYRGRGESHEDKMYIKFESQLKYADKIVDEYIKENSK